MKKYNNFKGLSKYNKRSLFNRSLSTKVLSKTGRVVSPEFRKKVNTKLQEVLTSVNLIRKNVSQQAVDQAVEGEVLIIEENLNHCIRRLSEINKLVIDNQLLKRIKKSDSLVDKLIKAGKFSSIEEYNEFKKSK